jgi:DNA-binding transcriptional LysR family regulator
VSAPKKTDRAPGGSVRLIRNVPTDLLRALVTVVDLKGFTRAGERLGRSQPAISLQIKRLQELLGADLFDREAGGAQLSEQGQVVLSYARRMLSLNDEMLSRLDHANSAPRLRLGMSEIYAYYVLPRLFAEDKAKKLSQNYEVSCDLSSNLISGFDGDEYDLILAFGDGARDGEFLSWTDETVWIGAAGEVLPSDQPVPLAVLSNECVFRRSMIEQLVRSSRDYKIVMTTPSLIGLKSALDAGIAISAVSSRVYCNRTTPMPRECGLPRLPDQRVGIYIRDNGNSAASRALAMRLADLIGVSTGEAVA